jgi:hypothetical protein
MYPRFQKLLYWRWDRFSRYYPVIKYLRSKYGASQINILEVGCGDYSMGLYDGYKVDGLDIRPTENLVFLNDFIQGSITDSKIPSSSYDIVVCVDVLEHIPPKSRGTAIKEMLRLARKEVILVYPEGAEALENDKLLYKHYRARISSRHIWFQEHLDFGLPEDEEVSNAVKEFSRVNQVKVKAYFEKLNNLKKHTLYSKFLMSKIYRWFLFKNKLLFIYDLLFGRFWSSEKYYRSFVRLERL